MPLAFDREIASRKRALALVPEGQPRIARRFNAGFRVGNGKSRKGRLRERVISAVPFGTRRSVGLGPALKRRAILKPSLRDEDEKLVALDKAVRAPISEVVWNI